MASRRNPGGGVLGGAGAQEENLFRRSTLLQSLYQYANYAAEYDVPQNRDGERYPIPVDPAASTHPQRRSFVRPRTADTRCSPVPTQRASSPFRRSRDRKPLSWAASSGSRTKWPQPCSASPGPRSGEVPRACGRSPGAPWRRAWSGTDQGGRSSRDPARINACWSGSEPPPSLGLLDPQGLGGASPLSAARIRTAQTAIRDGRQPRPNPAPTSGVSGSG